MKADLAEISSEKQSISCLPENQLSLLQNYLNPDGALWLPLPGPQLEAYVSEADEVFYGGSAGSGKSALLLGLALTSHRRSVIFRRTYPELREFIQASRELLSRSNAKYNGQDHIWRDVPGGRIIEFGSVQYETDLWKWQGRPHDLIGMDEIPQFPEAYFDFLRGWARTTAKGQRVRVLCTGNPPLPGLEGNDESWQGEWVIRRWAPWLDDQHPNPARPGEIRWFAKLGEDFKIEEVEVQNGEPFEWGGKTVKPYSRTFIPASLKDNPFLVATNYEKQLQSLPEPMRSLLLRGFDAYRELRKSLKQDHPAQVIPSEWVDLAMQRWKEIEKPLLPLTALGVDPSRGGKDLTTIAKLYGTWFDRVIAYPGEQMKDGPIVAATVIGHLDNHAPIGIDLIGWGSSAFDDLKYNQLPVVGINSAASPPNAPQFDKSGRFKLRNLRSFMWWRFREALDPESGLDICLPPDHELKRQLCAPRQGLTSTGLLVEEKADIKDRLGVSPDIADAIVYAWHVGGRKAAMQGSGFSFSGVRKSPLSFGR